MLKFQNFHKGLVCLFLLFVSSSLQAGVGDVKADTVLVPFGSVFTEVFDEKLQSEALTLNEQPSVKKVLQVEGYMASMKGGAFREVVLKNAEGEELKMVWMLDGKHREERELSPTKWFNHKVRVSYETVSCYLPKQGAYSKMLKITGIQFVE